jgi:acyl-CoA synthetase (NDP forming)
VNQAELRDILHRVSALALDFPEIGELDLNPVLAFPGNDPAVVLDARLKLSQSSAKSSEPEAAVAT